MLKDELCNALTLMHLDFTKGFILYCDGSKECGYGAALYQKDNEGIEQPILYLFKVLDKHEQNYWSTKLEVGALVWALAKLKQYTDAGELTVITDHSAIKSMATILKEGKWSNQLNNWALFLSRYADHMIIKHREGKSHKNADGLSRLPTRADAKAGAWTIDVTMIEPTLRSLIVQNLSSDKHLRSIYIDIMQ